MHQDYRHNFKMWIVQFFPVRKLLPKKQNTYFIDQTMDKLFPISTTNNHQHHLSLFWYHKTITEIKSM